ncbi:nuclear pore complex assembly-domain-containing protein [Lipomyces kononenkoae]|uniref:Nuclear pore complex assembly-domain-containing protein n=1 Tax=Lipomyces kononenkoae TaxID=34357 RepID=A0ACC3SWE2_LIPKO
MDEEMEDSIEVIFPSSEFPYDKQLLNYLSIQRNKLDGYLFFDLLATGIAAVSDAQDLYPPRDPTALQDLYDRIAASQADILKKHCLLYYILKDYGPERASGYVDSVLLPDAHKKLIDGVYAFDRFQFQEAMKNLTHPSVRLQFTEKILRTLLNHCDNGPQYIRIYVAVTNQVLDTREATTMYLDALSRVSIFSALEFVRTMPPGERAESYSMLIDFSLSHGPNSSAYQIANLPLTEDEEKIIIPYLGSRPDPTSKNALIVRELHRGHVDNAQKVAKSINRQISLGTGKDKQWVAMAQKLKRNPGQLL